MGKKYCQAKKINKRRIMNPDCSRYPLNRDIDGKKAKRILEPSKGGMGIRLNTARIILIKIIKAATSGKTPSLRKMAKIIATIMLDNGPAPATIASENLPGRRLCGLYGTGLAQPMIKPPKL